MADFIRDIAVVVLGIAWWTVLRAVFAVIMKHTGNAQKMYDAIKDDEYRPALVADLEGRK
jgi:hypothetical protein